MERKWNYMCFNLRYNTTQLPESTEMDQQQKKCNENVIHLSSMHLIV